MNKCHLELELKIYFSIRNKYHHHEQKMEIHNRSKIEAEMQKIIDEKIAISRKVFTRDANLQFWNCDCFLLFSYREFVNQSN